MARLFDLQNPLNIIIAAAVALLVVGILVVVFLRLRQGGREAVMRGVSMR